MTGVASVLNGLSSIGASTLATQPGPQLAEAIATLVAIGVVGAGTLAVISYKEWTAYEAKKHREKILAINKLYADHLQKLTIPGGTTIPSLPPIFQFKTEPTADAKTTSEKIDSLHYNDDEVADIGRVLPEVPVELTRYRQSVLDALLKLKEYYFHLGKNDDVTKGVLSYLLNILQNRCLSFAGYDYDITYLNALIAFITDYASQEHSENSPHFSHLRPVYTSLMDAVQNLDKHKESMSLSKLVDETRNACLDESNQLIRLLVKMVIPGKYQVIADTVAQKELAQDIIRKPYINHAFWGLPILTQKEIDLPNSIFHNWIMDIAQYYLLSQTPGIIIHEKKIIHPEDLFTFINWARPALAQQELAKKDKQQPMLSKPDRNKLHQGLELIHKVFKQSPNFINSKLTGSEKEPEFVVIEDDKELLDACEVMANFTHLIHGVISLQALCAELASKMQQLGLDFFDNQDNFNKIFAAFNTLFTVVQNDLHTMKQKMVEISVANKNTLRLADKIQFQDAVKNALEQIEFRVLPAAEKVKNYKNKHPKTVDISVREALSAAEFFQQLYGIRITPPSPQPTAPKVEPQRPQESPATTTPNQTSATIAEMASALDEFSSQLFIAVAKIQQERRQDPNATTYQKIQNALRDLQIKTIAMLNEKDPGADRLNKTQNIYKLTYSLYAETIQFLAQHPDDRNKERDEFVGKIHTQLNCVENRAFIDRHHNSIPKLIYENFGFFQTATRTKLSVLDKACQSLQMEANAGTCF